MSDNMNKTISDNPNPVEEQGLNFETTRNINGPLATYRLEGYVGNIKKVLYLFADSHVLETKCKNEISLDINQYIIREFNKINNNSDKITYDFFLETFAFNTGETEKSSTSYLQDLRNTFRRYTNFEATTNKMTISKFGKKSRLHYIDIRNNIIFNIIFSSGPNVKDVMQTRKLYSIRESIYALYLDLMLLYMILTQNDIKTIGENASQKMKEKTNLIDLLKTEYNMESSNEYLKSIIKKLNTVYENEYIKKIIVIHLDEIIQNVNLCIVKITKLYEEIDEFIKEIESHYNKLNKKNYGIPYIEKLKKLQKWELEYEIIFDSFTKENVYLMDLYFLRRFLDKSYVTNGITFTGAMHSMNVIYMLINKFNFSITDSTVNKHTINDINKMIKNKKDFITDMDFMYNLLMPNSINQCSDLTNFPELFL